MKTGTDERSALKAQRTGLYMGFLDRDTHPADKKRNTRVTNSEKHSSGHGMPLTVAFISHNIVKRVAHRRELITEERMRKKKILSALMAGALCAASSVGAQPQLRKGGTSPDTTGEDQRANVGSVVTNPTTTSAPTSQKNAPVFVPDLHDQTIGRSEAEVRDTVRPGDEMTTRRGPANRVESSVSERAQGGGADGLPAKDLDRLPRRDSGRRDERR